MKPRVYIETTIPSYYYDERPELARDVARTREWWDHERQQFDCVTSVVVVQELSAQGYRNRDRAVALLKGISHLPITDEVDALSVFYRHHMLLPRRAVFDALHLALVCYHQVDVLLTWNCAHLANTSKMKHLEVLNQRAGMHPPLLVTPHELRFWEKTP